MFIKHPERIGFVFYNRQDNDNDNGRVYLTFGTLEGPDELCLKVGQIIVEELRRAGVKVNWNEDVNIRIICSA